MKDLRGKKILLLLPSLELGGSEKQAILLAKHVDKHEGGFVHIWSIGNDKIGKLTDHCEELNIPWKIIFHNWVGKTRLIKVRNLIALIIAINNLKPDAILSFSPLPNMACGLISPFIGPRKIIWGQRGSGFSKILARRFQKLSTKFIKRYISNSQHGADFLHYELGIPRSMISVIYNGVEFRPAINTQNQWRKSLRVKKDTILACMIANLSDRKDHETLLNSWRIVVNQLAGSSIEAVLLLAGSDLGQMDRIKSIAFDLDLYQHIRFLGQVEDISGLLETVNLGVFSSRSEGLPNGVVECMAASLPVVATDIPGIREALGDNCQYLAPIGDHIKMAERILVLLMNNDLCQKVGKFNKQRVDILFDPKKMCKRTVSVIEMILK